jgi:glycerophosphoryl diester phosphodiesterase
MKYYYDLGVDGLFTDYADTGVEARDASVNASNVIANNQCKNPQKDR